MVLEQAGRVANAPRSTISGLGRGGDAARVRTVHPPGRNGLWPRPRELVRSVAFAVVYESVDFPAWCPTYGERRETTRRLVNAALGD